MSYRKGYFMSAEQERAAKGDLLLEYQETKHRLGPLRAAADKLAVKLENMAKQLRTEPRMMTFDASMLPGYSAELEKILTDIKTTHAEFQRLGERVREAGIAHLVKE
jgi:hypothetical protein